MSISIDDLVSSFSSAHVGQEQNDLAALHAQLAETLFGASSFASSSRAAQRSHQTCTTPTARSPTTSSFNWGEIDAGYRSRSSSISHRGPSGYEDTEDEMMVEELLMPAASSSSVFENTHSKRIPAPSYHQRTPSLSMNYDPLPSPSSHFTSSDPFYLQTQANAQSYFYENSNLTQRGRPSMSSPFVAAAANQFGGYQYQMPSAMA
ncbi:hypothetical protein NMY22_g15456 [Coprinellus aureogranulatus]|nr:hypothetical protein NMY22_g15456 [Coprinellus aureogranulatus]